MALVVSISGWSPSSMASCQHPALPAHRDASKGQSRNSGRLRPSAPGLDIVRMMALAPPSPCSADPSSTPWPPPLKAAVANLLNPDRKEMKVAWYSPAASRLQTSNEESAGQDCRGSRGVMWRSKSRPKKGVRDAFSCLPGHLPSIRKIMK